MIPRAFTRSMLLFCGALSSASALTPEQQAKLPPPAPHQVDFTKEIQPLLEASCIKCHAKGKAKGGLSLETRDLFLKGGESGPAAEPGKSVESLAVEMVSGLDPDNVMPKKGSKWTPQQVGLLRAWIDQGMSWPEGVTFARPEPPNLAPREVALPSGAESHPIDRLLKPYLAAHEVNAATVDEAAFARRAYLDVVGLLPTPEQLDAFLSDTAQDKRAALVRQLLADNRGYAQHWLTFWNDLLRNDYRGTGFIDGGRRQISEWLYNALLTNLPYDRFVGELVNPRDEKTEGFTAGIRWRGNVTAAMQIPMQAAQSVSQVFLGINLKCASCHDSFVSDWSLADAYGMAAVFSDGPLELVHCDKPTGQQAALRFLYPQVGKLDPNASRAERLQRLAQLMAAPQNGRLSRTIVNRLWARVMGRGLVEPVDDMDQKAWNPELLDWLANDLVAHGYDLKRTLSAILTSQAYQMPSVETPGEKEAYVFRGPLTRRLGAEQFADAVSALTGDWAKLPSSLEFDLSGGGRFGEFQMPRWVWTDEPLELASRRAAWRNAKAKADAAQAKAAEAQRLVEGNAPEAAAAMQAAEAAAELAAQAAKAAATAQDAGRHKVIFRKRFNLEAKPDAAFATLAASQSFEVRVNGVEMKQKMNDGARNGRIKLYDFSSALRAGENVIAISVDSHTEKQMNDTERKEFPASAQHLNKVSGLAFYLRCRSGNGFTEVVSDPSWRVRRAPEGDWSAPQLADVAWASVSPLADGVAPVDEGPGLEPIRRKDFANIPVSLGPPLRAAVSTAALSHQVRAAMLAADPLQVALDRPNREIVTPVRQSAPTTLQTLELTNGATLNAALQRAGARLAEAAAADPAGWVDRLYRFALSRQPTERERAIALEMLGTPARAEGAADFLWALAMLPEFQFIN